MTWSQAALIMARATVGVYLVMAVCLFMSGRTKDAAVAFTFAVSNAVIFW